MGLNNAQVISAVKVSIAIATPGYSWKGHKSCSLIQSEDNSVVKYE